MSKIKTCNVTKLTGKTRLDAGIMNLKPGPDLNGNSESTSSRGQQSQSCKAAQ